MSGILSFRLTLGGPEFKQKWFRHNLGDLELKSKLQLRKHLLDPEEKQQNKPQLKLPFEGRESKHKLKPIKQLTKVLF